MRRLPQPPDPPICVLAPAPVAGSYRFRMDSLLTALKKAQVPTNTLYDRVPGDNTKT